MPVLFVILMIALVVIGAIYGAIAARKRREAFVLLAARLGLGYSAARNYELADRFGFLNKLAQGSNRYAYNVLSGNYDEHAVLAFDYHYETHTTDSKGRRHTHHHHLSFFLVMLEKAFPELIITGEGIFSKIAQAFGYDDIDFESHEFSRKFCVRSRDKKFAYDFCHARMMEYLLANDDLNIEVEGPVLAIGFGRTLAIEQIEPNLKRLIEVRKLMPNYLFANV